MIGRILRALARPTNPDPRTREAARRVERKLSAPRPTDRPAPANPAARFPCCP